MLWTWPVADEVADLAPRPPGWPPILQGFYLLHMSAVWPDAWWKLTEVYLLECYYHLRDNLPGKALDRDLLWADADAKWNLAVETLIRAKVVRMVDGFPTRAAKVERPGPWECSQTPGEPGALREDLEQQHARS